MLLEDFPVLNISELRRQADKLLIEWVKLQDWSIIPDLARRADGVSGFSDQLSYCYRHGFWVIRWQSDKQNAILINCNTRTIHSSHDSDHRPELAAELEIEDVTVSKIVNSLESTIHSCKYEDRHDVRTNQISHLTGLTKRK